MLSAIGSAASTAARGASGAKKIFDALQSKTESGGLRFRVKNRVAHELPTVIDTIRTLAETDLTQSIQSEQGETLSLYAYKHERKRWAWSRRNEERVSHFLKRENLSFFQLIVQAHEIKISLDTTRSIRGSAPVIASILGLLMHASLTSNNLLRIHQNSIEVLERIRRTLRAEWQHTNCLSQHGLYNKARSEAISKLFAFTHELMLVYKSIHPGPDIDDRSHWWTLGLECIQRECTHLLLKLSEKRSLLDGTPCRIKTFSHFQKSKVSEISSLYKGRALQQWFNSMISLAGTKMPIKAAFEAYPRSGELQSLLKNLALLLEQVHCRKVAANACLKKTQEETTGETTIYGAFSPPQKQEAEEITRLIQYLAFLGVLSRSFTDLRQSQGLTLLCFFMREINALPNNLNIVFHQEIFKEKDLGIDETEPKSSDPSRQKIALIRAAEELQGAHPSLLSSFETNATRTPEVHANALRIAERFGFNAFMQHSPIDALTYDEKTQHVLHVTTWIADFFSFCKNLELQAPHFHAIPTVLIDAALAWIQAAESSIKQIQTEQQSLPKTGATPLQIGTTRAFEADTMRIQTDLRFLHEALTTFRATLQTPSTGTPDRPGTNHKTGSWIRRLCTLLEQNTQILIKITQEKSSPEKDQASGINPVLQKTIMGQQQNAMPGQTEATIGPVAEAQDEEGGQDESKRDEKKYTETSIQRCLNETLRILLNIDTTLIIMCMRLFNVEHTLEQSAGLKLKQQLIDLKNKLQLTLQACKILCEGPDPFFISKEVYVANAFFQRNHSANALFPLGPAGSGGGHRAGSAPAPTPTISTSENPSNGQYTSATRYIVSTSGRVSPAAASLGYLQSPSRGQAVEYLTHPAPLSGISQLYDPPALPLGAHMPEFRNVHPRAETKRNESRLVRYHG